MIEFAKNWERGELNEKRALRMAICIGVLTHLAIVGILIFMPAKSAPPIFTTLAVADLSPYDPLGGQGGIEELSPPEEFFEPPEEPEPYFEPEELPLVESEAPKAEPVATLPPPKKEKPPNVKPPKRSKPAPQVPVVPAAGTALGSSGAGPGGTPGGSGVGNSNELDAYKAMVRSRMERGKKYPPAAQARRQTGLVRVSFVINQDGQIHSATLVESSGHGILDDEVMALLRRVSPLPPLPASTGLTSLKITVPMRFSLN